MKRLVFALLAVLSCALFVVPEQAVAQVPTADSLMGDHCYPLGFSDLKPGASATTPSRTTSSSCRQAVSWEVLVWAPRTTSSLEMMLSRI